MKKFSFVIASLFWTTAALFAQEVPENSTIWSKSDIDWTTNTFKTVVNLETEKARIPMPTGKSTAEFKTDTELPLLIKEPLLSLYVNSNQMLGDIVLSDKVTLEQLTDIIDAGKKSPGVFSKGSATYKTIHSIDTKNISNLMIRHKTSYKNPSPVEKIPSRPYTGIIIDARGLLNVQGEFLTDEAYPCFFPQIWDEDMNLVFERNFAEPELQKKQGIVQYHWSDDENLYKDRVGNDPLHINARKIYGEFRTDPVISHSDALKILTVPQNVELLRQGKIVVLLDKDNLIHPVSAPLHDDAYYAAVQELKQYIFEVIKDAEIDPDSKGAVSINYDLKFVADSPKLLDSELYKIANLAEAIKRLNSDNSYSILVEGHTADLNKPQGQMKLSVERTQTIVNELVKCGLDRSMFTRKGYGATQPIETNSTPEGRAANRRVIITARPKATYIQRR